MSFRVIVIALVISVLSAAGCSGTTEPTTQPQLADESVSADAAVPGLDDTVFFLQYEAGAIDYGGDNNVRNLFSVSLATGQISRITQFEQDSVGRPAFSPDGSLIAFAHGVPGGHADLYVSAPDGSGLQNIGSRNGRGRAFFTSDGERILTHDRINSREMISIIDISSGTKRTLVTSGGDHTFILGVTNDVLTYVHSAGNRQTLERFDLRSEEPIDAVNLGSISNPSLSPSGEQLVYANSFFPIDDGELAMIDLTTDPIETNLITGDLGLESGPMMSPDGQSIVYGVGPKWNQNVVQVTSPDEPFARKNLTRSLVADKVDAFVWTSGSEAIVFRAEQEDVSWIYVVTLDGRILDLGVRGTPVLVRPGGS